jgi:CBS domain containing-hemolysin-like protein
MLTDIFGFVLILVALLSIALQRFYSCVPAKELKRLAARGERLALTLYRPVAYGASLRALLWIIAGICLSLGFLLLGRSLPLLASLTVMLLVLALAVIWLPARQLGATSARLAALAAPVLEWVLHHLERPLDVLAGTVNSRRHIHAHSGLYEKADLHDLLTQQQEQQDSRIALSEIELMQRALHFADTKAIDIAISRKDAPMLSTSDALGPILFDELYKSGQQFFVVYRGKQDNVVGMLALKDAKHSRKGGTVADIMREDTCFVSEDFTLPQLASAFVKTGQQAAVVINKFEEFVGLISFEQLMSFLFAAQMANQPEVQYEDRAAVAGFTPSVSSRQEQPESEPEPDAMTSPEVSEVVE